MYKVGLMKDFFVRLISSTFIVVATVGFFFLRQLVDFRLMYIPIYAFCLFGTFEMTRALGDRLTTFLKCVAYAYAASATPVFCFVGATAVIAVSVAAALLVLLAMVFDFENTTVEGTACGFFALIYPTAILIPMMCINALTENAFIALLLVFAVAPFADSGAYLVGSVFKGPKLCEKVSPKKTISGAIGGLLGGALAGFLIWICYAKGRIFSSIGGDLAFYLIMGIIGAVLTMLGDLIEGAIKRKVGIKDMGKLFPGHGGMLDRIDGNMINAIFVFLVFSCVV